MPRKSIKAGSNRDPAPDDKELFRRLAAGTKPLKLDVIEPERPRPRATARFSRQDSRQVLIDSLREGIDAAESQNGDALRYRHPSIGRKTMRRLQRGGFSVQAEIDLHGLTAAEAEAALLHFVDSCRNRGYTCIRIVHGKGLRSGQTGPVLKKKVDVWLRRWAGILAFVSARQMDGGTGAVYVLLK